MTAATHTQHTPGPWRAEGATVKAVSHGQWFKVTRADGLNHTPEGNRNNAAFIVAACNAYDANLARIAELEAALRTFITLDPRCQHGVTHCGECAVCIGSAVLAKGAL